MSPQRRAASLPLAALAFTQPGGPEQSGCTGLASGHVQWVHARPAAARLARVCFVMMEDSGKTQEEAAALKTEIIGRLWRWRGRRPALGLAVGSSTADQERGREDVPMPSGERMAQWLDANRALRG